MNLIEFARFSLMTDSLVASPAKYDVILGNFWTSDSDVKGYQAALLAAFSDVSLARLVDESEASRLASLDSIESALQAASGGYDRVV